MKPLLRALLSIALIVLAACSAPAPKSSSKTYSPLILISIDGFRADYFDRGLTPTLRAIAAEGVHAQAMRPSFPSLTFPNHYTLVTGLYPDHHGMVNNTMWDPDLGKFALSNKEAARDRRWWDGGEPIWVTADKQGLRTATMFWPGSEAPIHGFRPDYYKPFDGKVSADRRVDQVLAWLDLPADERPQFVTLYLDRVDHEGHDHGPDSPEVAQALRDTDAALGRFVEQLKRRDLYTRANIVIVSDHGMAATTQGQNIVLDRLVDLHEVDVVSLGVVAGMNPKPGRTQAVEKSLLAAHDHVTCWRKGGVPARLHYGTHPRVPALICLADDGWRIETQAMLDRQHHIEGGEHGYDNADPNMRALFIAHGPAFKQGLTLGEFDNIHVYALLTRLLGITPEPNDGDPAATAPMMRR